MNKLISMILDEAGKGTGLGFAWTACFVISIAITIFCIIYFLVWMAFTYPVVVYFYAMVPIALLGILVYKTYEKYKEKES